MINTDTRNTTHFDVYQNLIDKNHVSAKQLFVPSSAKVYFYFVDYQENLCIILIVKTV